MKAIDTVEHPYRICNEDGTEWAHFSNREGAEWVLSYRRYTFIEVADKNGRNWKATIGPEEKVG